MRESSRVSWARGTAVAVATVCFVMACGDPESSSTDTTGDTGSTDTVIDFSRALGDAYCSAAFSCYYGNDDVIGMVAAFGTEERCRDVLSAYFPRAGDIWRELREAEARGALTIDPEAASACADFYGESCLLSGDVLDFAICRAAFTGSVEAGGACASNAECAGDAYCEYDAGVCPGACRARKGPGEACENAEECSAPEGGLAVCDWGDGTSGACGQWSIGSPAALGEPCGNIGDGIVPCSPETWCENDGTSGVCAAPIPAGAPCTDIDQACERGAFCVGPDGAQTCQQVELIRETGAPCGSVSDTGSYCDVFGGFQCVNDTCQPLGDGSLGSSCSTSDSGDLIPCAEGLFCDGSTGVGTCQPLVSSGEPCEADRACESGTCGADSMCAATYCPAN